MNVAQPVAYFLRLGDLIAAPFGALRAASAGQWNAVRDALALVVLAVLAIFTVDLARVFIIGYDLGLREGLMELTWAAQRRLLPDMIALLGIAVVVVAPLRLARRLPYDQALALAVAAWIPCFLVRLAAHTLRLHLDREPTRFFEGPEWWIGLTWSGIMVGYGLAHALRHGGEPPASATPPEEDRS